MQVTRHTDPFLSFVYVSLFSNAVSQKLNYDKSPQDEVEDLYELLLEIKQRHPEIQGISCGAIVSNYQRTRVEHVCKRLGLIPLTYLWMLDRNTLLDSIISAGVEAVLVKVAGAGLVPEKHLGKSLGDLRPDLLRFHKKYGLDLCGEGGEYESLVLDCPAFRTHRIELGSTEIVLDSEDPTVGNLKVLSATLVTKTSELSLDSSTEVIVLHGKNESTLAARLESSAEIVSAAATSTPCIHACSTLGTAGLGNSELVFPDTLAGPTGHRSTSTPFASDVYFKDISIL